MKELHFVAVCALLLVAGCGGSSNTAPSTPVAQNSMTPATSGAESISPSTSATIVQLPNIGGIYGGQMVLPPGNGTATLTFSLNPPPGVSVLKELTPQPQVAYITITAQSAFTLAASPGLNLTVPSQYMSIDMWLNYYGSGSWLSNQQQLGWPSTTSGTSAVCFKEQGGSISLGSGQSLYLGINGDSVLPTPVPTGITPPCPQNA